jgi:hypothetical protein
MSGSWTNFNINEYVRAQNPETVIPDKDTAKNAVVPEINENN